VILLLERAQMLIAADMMVVYGILKIVDVLLVNSKSTIGGVLSENFGTLKVSNYSFDFKRGA
jgi:hypothetical protein